MAVLNKKTCIVQGANTGFGNCVLSFAHIAGAILVPRGTQFTPEDLEDFQAALETRAMAANPQQRIFPIHHFEQVTDNTEDKTIETLGYGGKYPVREGDYDWTFQFLQGGICLLKSLRKFNGAGMNALFYDANGVVFGQKIGDNLAGIPLVFFWADQWRPSDGTASSVYAVQFVFKPRYINDDLGFVETDFNPSLVQGLKDVVLSEGAGSARPALKVLAHTGCSRDNLYDLYADELAAVAAWTATINGGSVAITSVAEDPAIGGWTVTLDDTDPNYDANDPIILSLADPVTLDGLGVSGYESRKLTITA